ncbi:MAG: Phenylacetic acid catabolic protein [Armatimonadota bacterium]|nr:Phenylacetic acid catabolic protein [Armatimonadota bacterium]MDR7538205.1 Phenylacetic acid catabolic protein [Armatimonadota bacterium]
MNHEVTSAPELALPALVNLIVVLADTKYFLGRRLSEWAPAAPFLEASVACAAIAQEDLGHSRAIYPLLEDLAYPNRPAPLERETDRDRRFCVRFLDAPFPTWSHVVAAAVLVDTAVTTMFEALVASRHEALASRVRRALEEERAHLGYAESLVRRLAAIPGGAAALQARVDEALTEMLCWYGPTGEAGVEMLRSQGFLAAANDALRQAYLRRVAPLLLEVGVHLPVRWNLEEGSWEVPPLPWERWNATQRRLEA